MNGNKPEGATRLLARALPHSDCFMHLLLIDDNPTFLQVARDYLTSLDRALTIRTASDAEGGLQAVREADFDVIVTDFRLPGLNGMQFLAECHRLHPETPVILLSGYGDVHLAQEAAQSGAYAFLHKPVDPDAFYSVVKRAALRSALRRRPTEVFAAQPLVQQQIIETARHHNRALDERLRQILDVQDISDVSQDDWAAALAVQIVEQFVSDDGPDDLLRLQQRIAAMFRVIRMQAMQDASKSQDPSASPSSRPNSDENIARDFPGPNIDL